MIETDFMKLYEELSEINGETALESIVNAVATEVEKYDNNGSNQNCLFSTWAVELQLRGEDFLPRPVYSPRDPIFDIKGEELVVKPEVLKISSKEDVETQVLDAGDGSRFYCHVNWADSKGGHEFLLINDNDSVLVVDGQAGYIKEINKDNKYFDDINFENSYIVRFDNKEINQDILKYNDDDQVVEWDDELDPPLLESVNDKALSIEGVSSPEELMAWMNENITYELVDDEYSNSNGVPTKTAKEVLDTGTGHCAEQSYLEKDVLDGLGYETFLVMVKENNSKKEYGAEGSAHVFLVYKEGKNYCWFEHSMQHARGIHKYTSLEALLQDAANQWWRYDKNSDIFEVRMMDKVITGVDNWGLAKECYKLPVEYTFDISDNIMESDVPLEESVSNNSQIEYLPVSDIELFKEYADDILDGFGGMSDANIKSSTKEIHFKGKLAGYISFSEYEENGSKCLGIGNFMIIERGKGLGSAVIQNIVEKYKNQYDLIYCFVDAKNDGAIRLYKKLGKVYDEDGPNDNGEYYVTFWDNGKWDLDEELSELTETVSTRESINFAQIDKAVKKTFGEDKPGEGATYIATDGTFINNFGEVHYDLMDWIVDEGFIQLPDHLTGDADYDWEDRNDFICGLTSIPSEGQFFVDQPLSYIRCNNDPGQCYLTLPKHLPTNAQLRSLELWLDELLFTERWHKATEIEFYRYGFGERKYYSLAEYSAKDLIQRIRRCYASGRFYEKLETR